MGMPGEGLLANAMIKELVREVPVCRLKDDVNDVSSRISGNGNIAVVVNADQIVLGLLELPIVGQSGKTIEDLMKPAPLTLRPSVLIAEAIAYFEESDLESALVTKSTGELMGEIRKNDLERFKHEKL